MAVDGVDPHIDQSLPLTGSFTGRGKLRDGKAPGTGNIGEELPEAEGEATTSCCRRPGLLSFQRGRQFYETQRKKTERSPPEHCSFDIKQNESPQERSISEEEAP